MRKHFDTASLLVVIVTLTLFIVALSTKGFTQDLLLESGIFLVSVKLIMMSYRNSVYIKSIEDELKEIKGLLRSGS
jgi:hypothetical protein